MPRCPPLNCAQPALTALVRPRPARQPGGVSHGADGTPRQRQSGRRPCSPCGCCGGRPHPPPGRSWRQDCRPAVRHRVGASVPAPATTGIAVENEPGHLRRVAGVPLNLIPAALVHAIADVGYLLHRRVHLTGVLQTTFTLPCPVPASPFLRPADLLTPRARPSPGGSGTWPSSGPPVSSIVLMWAWP